MLSFRGFMDYTGMLFLPLLKRSRFFLFFFCYFIVMSDHNRHGMTWSASLDKCVVCQDGTDLDKVCT